MRTAPAALLGLFLVLLPCALRGQQPGTTAPWPEAQRELLARHCADCHGDGAAKGNFRLESLLGGDVLQEG